MIGRGVFNRRAAISWIRENAEDDGVVYFADDDNSYDTRQVDITHIEALCNTESLKSNT